MTLDDDELKLAETALVYLRRRLDDEIGGPNVVASTATASIATNYCVPKIDALIRRIIQHWEHEGA